LERLEGGEFDGQPDGFARGFVRAVATALGLDPDDAVSRMLTEVDMPAESQRNLMLGRAALVLGAVLALALGAALWAALVGGDEAPRPPDEALVLRRDAVRTLAAEMAVRDADARPPESASGGDDAD
jgi:cytoskeletal protein RodZ